MITPASQEVVAAVSRCTGATVAGIMDFLRRDVCVWRQLPGLLQPWLVAKQAWIDGQVVRLIENIYASAGACVVVSKHVCRMPYMQELMKDT